MQIRVKILVLQLISYAQRARDCANKPVFFSQIQPTTQTIVIECAT